ncbi:flavin-containing monooxygenase [Candidatus Poriferisodalis sp.]|uniref:flavin-containing monooxygenase n=1 Tax=Candidatus Poriferisodalis sp. TaxID=3101277 RepID=UPI003B022587
MAQKTGKPQNVFNFDYSREVDERPPQSYYDDIKARFAEERDVRLGHRPPGTQMYTSDLVGELARYEEDPYSAELPEREAVCDEVEVLFIGGGFSALLTSARLRQKGVESIRIIERGADVGGTWYWNRYPGVACDVVSYDYLPLLDETGYVPSRHYATGEEIFDYCRLIARKYDLYELAMFQTTVTSTIWDSDAEVWRIDTDRGDEITAKFVICANGTLSKPKLAVISGMERFSGHSFHTSRWDYDYTGADLENLADKRVGIIGTGATAVQAIPQLGEMSKELYVFQRTPSSIDIRDDWETNPEWAAKLKPGWQARRRARAMAGPRQPRQDHPQPRLHPRLLQLRGRREPPPRRQLQRQHQAVPGLHGPRPRQHDRELRAHQAWRLSRQAKPWLERPVSAANKSGKQEAASGPRTHP